MKRIIKTTLFIFALVTALIGCSPSSAVTPIPPVLLDASDISASGLVKASGVVVPVSEAHLSFVIPGMVTEITVKEGDQVTAGQVLAKLDTTSLEYDIVAAKAALTSAEIEAQTQRQLRKRFSMDTFKFESVSLPGEKIQQADLNVEQKRYALEALEASLAQGTLLSLMDGTVIAVNVMPGEYIQTSQAILELADLSNLQIETTDLSELNIATVEIGQPVMVFVEALGESYPGTVAAISPISDTIGGDVVFKVTIKLDEQPNDLLWGMSAEVEIKTQ